MPTATAKGVPYPVDGDPPDVPKDMGALATWNDGNPGVAVMTTAQRDALAAPQKWVGRVIYNTTTTTHEGYNGTAWVPIGAGVQSMDQTAIDALPVAQKSEGMLVWNTTLGMHQTWAQNRWRDVEVRSFTMAGINALPANQALYIPEIFYDITNGIMRYNWGGSNFPMIGNMPRITTTQRDALAAYYLTGGQVIWNTTTGRHEWYDAAALTWRALNPYTSGGYGNVASTAFGQSAQLTTAYTTIGNLVFQALAGRRYHVTAVLGCSCGSAADSVTWQIVDGATILTSPTCTPPSFAYAATSIDFYIDGGASARQVTLALRAAAGNGTLGAKQERATILVDDVGESGQVTTPTTIVPPDMWNAAWGAVVAPSVLASGSNAFGATYTTITGLTQTYTLVAGRRYRVRFAGNATKPGAGTGYVRAKIMDGGAVLVGGPSFAFSNANGAVDSDTTGYVSGDGAAHTFTVQASVDADTANYATGTLLTLEDVGPSSPIAPSTWPSKGSGTRIPWTPVVRQTNPIAGNITVADLTRVGDRVQGELTWLATGVGAAVQLVIDYPNGWKPISTANPLIGSGYLSNPGVGFVYLVAAPAGILFLGPTGSAIVVAIAANHNFGVQFSFLSAT